ncbi:uncharacterized protein LY89DRAFT_743184 [Mollisia scopiformis]|uniref:Uncharacterized protein n=1 Tax=Mollisia scopiformis TaxID=149040 RepID=A0A132B444_MOLSC|nr:uncharacterized protein LY89DRAFT_743184 [Mollisia scopiformis]KUJ07185.1 hypothetical protein LY89DRAFT_743184 [Mollisia scopiformis]
MHSGGARNASGFDKDEYPLETSQVPVSPYTMDPVVAASAIDSLSVSHEDPLETIKDLKRQLANTKRAKIIAAKLLTESVAKAENMERKLEKLKSIVEEQKVFAKRLEGWKDAYKAMEKTRDDFDEESNGLVLQHNELVIEYDKLVQEKGTAVEKCNPSLNTGARDEMEVEAQGGFEDAVSQIKSLSEKLNTLALEKAGLERAMDSFRVTREQENRAIEQNVGRATATYDQVVRNNGALEQQLSLTMATNQEFTAAGTALEQEMNALLQAKHTLEQDNCNLHQEKAILEQILATIKTTIQQLIADKKILEMDMEAVKAAKVELTTEKAAVEEELTVAKVAIEGLATDKAAIEEALRVAILNNDKITTEKTGIEAEVKKLEAEKEVLKGERSGLEEKLATSEAACVQLSTEKMEAEKYLERMVAILNAITGSEK